MPFDVDEQRDRQNIANSHFSQVLCKNTPKKKKLSPTICSET
jgi:hypothetical protein